MTSCVHKMCGRTYGQTNMKRAITLAKSTIREIGIICACSDHGQPRYQIELIVTVSIIVHYTPTRRVVGILEYPCPSVRP
jgi:hypothetical protein